MDARILETAGKLFLSRGFEGTGCEQVAAQAGCGKASIYARYADKAELFSAAVMFKVMNSAALIAEPSFDIPLTERLIVVCTAVLEQSLHPEAIQLKRLLISEAMRFPELVAQADRLDRDRAIAHVAKVLADGKTDTGTLERSTVAAAKLIEIAFAPLQLRALLGEELAVGQPMIRPSVEEAVAMLTRAGAFKAR